MNNEKVNGIEGCVGVFGPLIIKIKHSECGAIKEACEELVH